MSWPKLFKRKHHHTWRLLDERKYGDVTGPGCHDLVMVQALCRCTACACMTDDIFRWGDKPDSWWQGCALGGSSVKVLPAEEA